MHVARSVLYRGRRMTRPAEAKPTSRFLILGSVCVVVTALYFAREVLVPIALAILLSFLLAPVVRRFERWKLPRAVAVVVSVVLAFGLIGGVGFVVYDQLADVTGHMGDYAENAKKKLAAVQGPGGLVDWFHDRTVEVKKALATPTSKPASQPAAAATSPPSNAPPTLPPGVQQVEVVKQPGSASPLSVAESVFAEVMGRAGTAFIVVVFTVFMLLEREDLRDRVIRLVGRDQLTTTTEALDDAAARVSRYLLFQSVTNGAVGLVVCGALWLVGRIAGTPFPSPALWGLLAALMRFIPYVGIWLSAALPVLLSLAVFASFKWTFATIGVYVVVELVTANAIEPFLFGSSTGIGSLAVLVAAAFWTWLWGPIGLLLSTPLTVCLVVMGKYVPSLNFLSILLSDEPALKPPDRVYQRLLAQDQEEAADLVREYARTIPLEQLYDEVLLPALAMAEADANGGVLTADRQAAIHKGVSDLVDELGEQAKADASKATTQAAVDVAKGRGDRVDPAVAVAARGSLAVAPKGTRVHLPDGCVLNVVCLPAHDATDQLSAVILGQLLQLRGYCVTVLSTDQLASEMVAAVEAAKPDAVVVSALPPAAVSNARYLCKRLHHRDDGPELIIGLWTLPGDLARIKDRLGCPGNARLVGSLRAAITQLHEILQPKFINAALAARTVEPT